MNYMADVAQMLGVEIGEKFKICEHNGNTYTLTEDGLYYYENGSNKLIRSCLFEKLITGPLKIIKIPKSILTDKEKEDLSGIIRLFRDEVVSICKFESMRHCGYEFLSIKINNNVFKYETTLPYFKKGTMYKGMKSDILYSLEDLGLWKIQIWTFYQQSRAYYLSLL